MMIHVLCVLLLLTGCSLQPVDPSEPPEDDGTGGGDGGGRGGDDGTVVDWGNPLVDVEFPGGRMLGTLYFGEALNWQNLQVREEILELDFLILGESVRSSTSYTGMVASLHADKPSLQVIEYTSFPWIWDVCNNPHPPGRVPCTDYGRLLYDAFYPQDIAHITPANPHPDVADTAFHVDGFYMIDLDNPGVPERIAAVIHEFIQSGGNPDVDGVLLDFFQALWGGWCLYGNARVHLGYEGAPYWLDYDRDGIGVRDDPDESRAVRDAFARLVDELHVLFGPEFLVISNGIDGYFGGEMSDGNDFAERLDGALCEQFPMYWSAEDYWLTALGLLGRSRADGQNAWQIAVKGPQQTHIPTPPGNYFLMDTFNQQNNPWICVTAVLFDNVVACVSGNPDNGRTEWVGGDPLPRLEELGPPLGPAVIDGNRISREFVGGSVVAEFSNVPAELMVEPWSGGRIHAPNGPFKYLVTGSAEGDTLYVGGGWGAD